MWLAVFVVLIVAFGLPALTGAPYVPTHRRQIKRAFKELRPIDSNDYVVDLGSGDGSVLAEVARLGASGVGYEINPILFLISKLRLARTSNIKIILGSFWGKAALAEVNVVYVFGESRDIKRMYDLVQKWANQNEREIDLISYGFVVPGMEHDKMVGSALRGRRPERRGGDR